MTQTPLDRRNLRYVWLVRLTLFALGLALIIAGHVRLIAAEQTPELTSGLLIDLMPDNCERLSLCRYPFFPPYVGSALLVIAAGIALTLAGKPAGSIFDDLPRPVGWKAQLGPSRWRIAYYGTAAVALLYSVWIIYPAIDQKTLPDPQSWAINIVLAGVAVFCRDRAAKNPSLLTRREVILLAAYVLLLFGLGHVFGQFPADNMQGRLVIVGGAFYVLLLLWYHKIVTVPVCVLAFLAVAGMAAYTYRIDAWEYSFVGDEYAFYLNAHDYMQIPHPPHLLSDHGVYEQFATFSSYIQVATMRAYGNTIYRWRISEVLMVLLAIPALYGLMRLVVSEYAALLAGVVYLASHVVQAIAKIGYNNLQALPVVLTALALMALAIKRQNWLGVYLAGVVSTFAFYTFSLAVPLIVFPPLLLTVATLEKPKHWLKNAYALLPQLAIFLIAFFLVFYPRLFERRWVDNTLAKSVYQSEVASENRLRDQIIPNFLYTLTHSLTDAQDDHYVYGIHLDGISSVLMVAGVGWLLRRMARQRIAAFWMLAFILAAFIIGAMVPYLYPAHTRTYFIVVFYALFAGFGLDFVYRGWRIKGRWQKGASAALWVGLCAGIVYLNLHQLYVVSKAKGAQTPEAMLLKEVQNAPDDLTFYYISPFGYEGNTAMLLRVNGLNPARVWYLSNRDPAFTLTYIANYAHPPYRVLIHDQVRNLDVWFAGLERLLGPLDITYIRDPIGRIFFYRVMVAAPGGISAKIGPPEEFPAGLSKRSFIGAKFQELR